MDFTKVHQILTKLNQPEFRIKQIKKGYFQNLFDSWDQFLNLPLNLRAEIGKILFFCVAEKKLYKSEDKKAYKALLSLEDGQAIESVLMLYKDYAAVCVSSQVGCALMCRFCATGQMGCIRNLTAGEIVDQVIYWKHFINNNLPKYKDKIINVLFMGMGEPFNNYVNVKKALEYLNDQDCLNIGARHISVSTSGIVPKIKEFAKLGKQYNLSVSLNASSEEVRKKIMPGAAKYSIKSILGAIDYYIEATNRKVLIEYVFLKGINDSVKDAKNLAKLLMNKKLIHVNLINYNYSGTIFKPSAEKAIEQFEKELIKAKISFTRRVSLGQDIEGACGQLKRSNSLK